MKSVYLTKAIIRKYRSIEELHINNIGSTTVLVGANESGKSNVLQALNWFGNNDPLSGDDLPVRGSRRISSKDPVIELYFKITEESNFLNLLEGKINAKLEENLGKGISVKKEELAKISNDTQGKDKRLGSAYLKLLKFSDGSHSGDMLDEQLRSLVSNFEKNLSGFLAIDNVKLKEEFNDFFDQRAENVLKNKNFQDEQIQNGVSSIRKNNNISPYLGDIELALDDIQESNNKDLLSILDDRITPLLNKLPNKNISVNINGQSVNLNPQNFLKSVYNQMKNKLGNVEKIDARNLLDGVFKEIKPEFIYLSEEMDLRGRVEKLGTWTDTLREDNENAINYRLFKILDIDIGEFDNKSISEKHLMLKNSLEPFSERLKELWKQQGKRIDHNVAEGEITFLIEDVDEKNRSIKATFPESRSRGFRWYLSYLITLEYLKNKENTILLLDDPAVFLHERGQKDFLKTIEEVSENTQVFYNTHLISLFDVRELDRVKLVELDENNRTRIAKPWTNEIENVATPVYHALGFDKLVFENEEKILFVEGIADKFIIEGFQKATERFINSGKKLKEYKEDIKWLRNLYIHPLFGAGNAGENELTQKIELLNKLFEPRETEIHFAIDGDKRDKKIENSNIIFLGDNSQELEDLFGDFYLDCVLECYQNIFIDQPEKISKLKGIIEELKEEVGKASQYSQITKKLDEKFNDNSLGNFSKVDVAIYMKRKSESGVNKNLLLNFLKTLKSRETEEKNKKEQ